MLAGRRGYEQIDAVFVDSLLVALDRRLGDQLDELLHHPAVQKLEAAWRGLALVVDSVRFEENIQVELANCSKQALADDFADAPEIPKSGLYRLAYTGAYATFGGKPYGLICADYEFGPGAEDLGLLRQCAAVAAMAHAPFITNIGPDFFGLQSFADLPRVRDLPAILAGPRYRLWHAFRDTEDARYVGLCAPRFLLRAPYGRRDSELTVKTFDFSEDVIDHHDRYLWGPASLALTARVAESFARYRWCPNIIGPQGGGSVHGLPLHQYEQGGELKTRLPCETTITDRQELQLANLGFIGLVLRQDSDNAAFFSASSAQRPRSFTRTPEGLAAQQSAQLGARLPYMFVITRLAHYLKVLQREQIGTWKGRADLERELTRWIRQYVADMPDPSAETRSRKPLRRARILVEDVDDQVGWYRCSLQIEPFIQFEGVSFTLSLVGKLDKQ